MSNNAKLIGFWIGNAWNLVTCRAGRNTLLHDVRIDVSKHLLRLLGRPIIGMNIGNLIVASAFSNVYPTARTWDIFFQGDLQNS